MPYEEKGASGLGWLGDGSAVLYNGSASPGAELWAMRADGGGQRRLGGKAVMAPAWSRDGTKLAYASGDPAGGSRIVVSRRPGPQALGRRACRFRDGAERRQSELVAGRDEDRRRRHRGRRRLGRGREDGSPHAGRGRRGVAGLVPRRRHHRVRRHRRSHGLGRGARRRRSAPAPAGVRGEDHGARLVTRREAARVQHRDGGLSRDARRPGPGEARDRGPESGPAELRARWLPARVRGRCRQRPPVPLRLRRRRRRQRAQAAHDRPARQHRPGLEAGGVRTSQS